MPTPLPFLTLRHTLFALLLCLLTVTTPALAAVTPEKSPNDHNAYRVITLDNGLQAALVSDPSAKKAAAALNVAVGSGNDPKGREGLAHFLEHMLFLGTEKYPKPGEYQNFIKSHGGSHNAFTAFQNTTYFFDVESDFLEPALDRFAQQFAAPLFTPEMVDRERQAVNSEFTSNIKDDGRRFYSVEKAAANPAHPFSQFAVGNLTTLENTDDNPLRPDLVQFWKTHYSANLMTLTVYGPQSLDQLEAMVRGRFDAIENRHFSQTTFDQPLYSPDSLPAKVTVNALKDVRRLVLTFPIPSQQALYETKPASYVANLLGHEGPGSLLDVLKRAGLAEGLSAGIGMDTGSNATLDISMSLTANGLKRVDDIVPLVFAEIRKIREQGITEARFEEMQQLANIDYRFREQSEPTSLVIGLSSQLQDYPAKDLLRAPYLMTRFAPDQYRALLNALTPDNVMVFVLAPDAKLEQPRTTQWYGAEWQRQPLSPKDLSDGAPEALASQLRLPDANPFVPQDLGMVPGPVMDQPERMTSVDGLPVWYARDTRFGTPKANVYVSLRTPATRADAQGAVMTRLLVDIINDNLNALTYDAQLAGLDYALYPHLRGITLRVGGYNDKLYALLDRILTQVSRPQLTEQRFNIARRNLIDELENDAKDAPVKQTVGFIQTALIGGVWSRQAQLDAAKSATLPELRRFAARFLDGVDPVMLAHGNLTRATALNLSRQVQALVLKGHPQGQVPRSQVRQLPDGETEVSLNVDHPDRGYTLYVQGRNTSFAERATYRVLGQILSSPFYEELRTNRQLGYIVYATPFEFLETPALGFVVQSPSASPEQIDQAASAFFKRFEKALSNLTPERLDREKQAVISGILEQDRQLGDISNRYWQEIDRGATGFDSRQRMAEAVKKVTLDDLKSAYQRALLDRSRALLVTTHGAVKDNAGDKTAEPAEKGARTSEAALDRQAGLSLLTARPPVPES